MDNVDAEFLNAFVKGVEEHVGLVDMVDVECEESWRACVLVAAFLSAEGSLPAHSRQVAFAVEIARSYLIAYGF